MAKIFPTNNNPVNITLYKDIPFDNTYKHHSLVYDWKYNGSSISSGTFAQSNFLERSYRRSNVVRKIYTRYELTGDFNFAYGNGLVTSVVLELSSAETLCNYMKVSSEGNTDLFYFITSITQLNGITYKLNLELDVIMTFGTEFMDSMKDIPVFTRRKHCFRVDENGWLGSMDFMHTEKDFVNVKPSLNYKHSLLDFETNVTINRDLRLINWIYIAYTGEDNPTSSSGNTNGYVHKGTRYGFSVLCLPLIDILYIKSEGSVYNWTMTINVRDSIQKLMSYEGYKGCKISPYPPFTQMGSYIQYYNPVPSSLSVTTSNGRVSTMTIKFTGENDTGISHSSWAVIDGTGNYWGLSFRMGNNNFNVISTGDTTPSKPWTKSGFIEVTTDMDNNFTLTPTNIVENSTLRNVPSIANSYNTNEWKLNLPPFKKYFLKTISNKGIELHPELRYSVRHITANDEWSFTSVTNCYPFNNAVFTYTSTQQSLQGVTSNGLSGVTNYTYPVGVNALDYFNQTQSASYYQGKTAEGISKALQILGGIGAVAIGGAMGKLGGAVAIASGVVGEIELASSIQAKKEDLLNTPDTFTSGGSSYAYDVSMTQIDAQAELLRLMPYTLSMKCEDYILKMAEESFYNFGYEVNRECYFNGDLATDVYSDSGGILKEDNHLFTRTLFNYIRIEDEITNKIGRNSGIPLVARQKLNTIFNNGITLWTFMKFPFTYGSSVIASSNTDNIDENYLFKMIYDNAEFYNQ